ncbi:C-C motif chemokine 20-like [Phyllobates terribilis]|uniref:C-C motif chemokine 20-like n=1 Tax=Phyllobates terribilis TaxID=111132 RepID=UPI003CCB598B
MLLQNPRKEKASTRKPLKSIMSGVSSLSMLFILLLGFQYSTSVFDCCHRYTRKPLPLKAVKGYMMQNSAEVCDIDAAILITKKFRVCANPKEPWVINIIAKLKKKKTNIEKSLKNVTIISGI